MNTLPETSYKKATQALNFLARKKDGNTINKMKAIKLIYLADRLHLRKYGRPVTGDIYWAMKLGPVGSKTKRAAELDLPENILSYTKKYIKPTDDKKHSLISIKEPDLNVFSKTDIECLEKVYDTFSDRDQFELAELTHKYPEWPKYEKELKSGKKKRVLMSYDELFSDSTQNGLFGQSKTELNLAKESFEELCEVSDFFAK
jgi:uncharacterized phage-associated protein